MEPNFGAWKESLNPNIKSLMSLQDASLSKQYQIFKLETEGGLVASDHLILNIVSDFDI